MKNIINKISLMFNKKDNKNYNINVVCNNASGELNAYCSQEYIHKG